MKLEAEKKVFNLEPSVRKYFQPNQITSETSIKPTFFSNYYLAINFPDSQSIILGARYYYNYLIHGIWFGLLLIIFGGFLSVFKKGFKILSLILASIIIFYFFIILYFKKKNLIQKL